MGLNGRRSGGGGGQERSGGGSRHVAVRRTPGRWSRAGRPPGDVLAVPRWWSGPGRRGSPAAGGEAGCAPPPRPPGGGWRTPPAAHQLPHGGWRSANPLGPGRPAPGGQQRRPDHGRVGSGRQLRPALEASIAQDGPPGTGGHAVAKAVVLGPLAGVRLVGALHWFPPRAPGTGASALRADDGSLVRCDPMARATAASRASDNATPRPPRGATGATTDPLRKAEGTVLRSPSCAGAREFTGPPARHNDARDPT